MKICKTCKVSKTLDNFHKWNHSKDKLQYDCIECRKIWRKKNAHIDKAYSKRNRLRDKLKTYNLSIDDYNALIKKQNNQCAICNKHGDDTKRGMLSIDHCHKTGVVRGLLCTGCNAAIGVFRDDPKLLARARRYLVGARKRAE